MKETNINFVTSNKNVFKAGVFFVLALFILKVLLYQVFGKVTRDWNVKNLTN